MQPGCSNFARPLQLFMLKLLSTDFDGTLVNHDLQPAIVPELFAVLQHLRQQGVHWAVNTGRTLAHLEDGLRREFGFPLEPDYAIVEERDIYRRTESGGWEPMGEWNGRAERDHAELFRLAAPILAEILAFLELLPGAQPIYDRGRFIGAVLATLDDTEKLCTFLDKFRARLPLFAYQRNTIYVRFCHQDYSKGTALGELARLLNLAPEHIMATGDHHNDLSMLDGRFAALITCPGNSCDEVKFAVKAAGGYLATGHAGAGFVEAMQHFGMWKRE
jgi:hydroxymethylpyrimidine pyrophosphatase-like HAD family hydrolase